MENEKTPGREKQNGGITMMNNEKIQKAIEIFKANLSGAKGQFRAYVSEANANEVDFFSEAGLYCTVNIRSGRIKGC